MKQNTFSLIEAVSQVYYNLWFYCNPDEENGCHSIEENKAIRIANILENVGVIEFIRSVAPENEIIEAENNLSMPDSQSDVIDEIISHCKNEYSPKEVLSMFNFSKIVHRPKTPITMSEAFRYKPLDIMTETILSRISLAWGFKGVEKKGHEYEFIPFYCDRGHSCNKNIQSSR